MAVESSSLKWFVGYNSEMRPTECKSVTLGLASPGSGTGIWNQFARLIPDEPIFGIRAPGRENRSSERPISSMPDFVSACTGAVEDVFQECSSIRLMSFCLSAKTIISVAVMMQKTRSSCNVELVLIEPNLWTPEKRVDWLSLTLQQLGEQLSEVSTIPASILSDPDVLEFFAPMIAADFELAENYDLPEASTLSADILIINTRHSGFDGARLEARCRGVTSGEVSVREVESPTSLLHCPAMVADTVMDVFRPRS